MKKITIYTDGACSGNPGPGGYGAVLLYKHGGRTYRKELYGGFRRTTNNRMEIISVIAGLEALKEPCDVMLFSDSRYVVDAIAKNWLKRWRENGWKRNKKDPALNADLWEHLWNLLQKHTVQFNWVKGHDGNTENERCDALARQAIEESDNWAEDVKSKYPSSAEAGSINLVVPPGGLR
jgi:ribonuclease HI